MPNGHGVLGLACTKRSFCRGAEPSQLNSKIFGDFSMLIKKFLLPKPNIKWSWSMSQNIRLDRCSNFGVLGNGTTDYMIPSLISISEFNFPLVSEDKESIQVILKFLDCCQKFFICLIKNVWHIARNQKISVRFNLPSKSLGPQNWSKGPC